MSDELEVRIAGNLREDVRLIVRDGETTAVSWVCASRSLFRDGQLIEQRTCLPIEVVGAAQAHAFAQQHRKGSRVVLRGTLVERRTPRTERLSLADGSGTAAVTIKRRDYVVVVERLLHIDATQTLAPTPPPPDRFPQTSASPSTGRSNIMPPTPLPRSDEAQMPLRAPWEL